MEATQRKQSCQNTNPEILFRNCNVIKSSQKSQTKEKIDTKHILQRQVDLTRTPNTLQNSGIFKQYDDHQQASFHSSFQNLSNPKHLNYQNQFKNDLRNQQTKNLNQFNFDENNQRNLESKTENSDLRKIHNITNKDDLKNSKKFEISPQKKNQNAQSFEQQEKLKNNFENKFQLFNQATYLNKINIKQSEKDLSNQTQESSYIEYAKKIIKQSDEQLQLLQRLTPRKRQSQEKQKKSQNQFQMPNEQKLFQKVILEDYPIQKVGSKLKLMDCSPQKQDENQYFSRVKKSKKPSQKQILNQEQYIIDQIRLEHSKYQKRTKNRPKSSGFSHQQSQLLRKKSNKQMINMSKNHSKLDNSQKSQESFINSTLKKQQNHISVNITNDKNNQMSSCISIRQYGTPGKTSKSQTKFNNTKELVSKSQVFKKKKESKIEVKSKEDTKTRLKQTQSSHRIQQNATQRCKSNLIENDSFVQQKVKNMQEEYLKQKFVESHKDISFRKSQIVKMNQKEEKLKVLQKDTQSSFKRQKSTEQFNDASKQKNNENQSKLRQSLFKENKNHYQSEEASQINLNEPIQNKNGKIIQKNYLRASKNQISKKFSQNQVDLQKNISILEEAQQSSQDHIIAEKFSKIQKPAQKELESPYKKQEKFDLFQKQKHEFQEEQKSKKQIFSHIKIITKPPENVQQEMNKNSQKQSQVQEFMSCKNNSVSPKKLKNQNLSPQNPTKKKLHFIFQKFGAVLKGYKTRRIYNHSKLVKQDRFEFRDLIQFAYSLKQELAQFQSKMKECSPLKDRSLNGHIKQKLEGQIEQTKKLLLQSLKDLIQKRQQFSIHFNRLLEDNTEWIYESRITKSKICGTPDTKYSKMNFLRKSQSLEPFMNSSINTKKKFNAQSPNKLKNTLKSPSVKNTENSSFKGSKMQSEFKEQYRKTDQKQIQNNHENQFKSQKYIKQNWNELKESDAVSDKNKSKIQMKTQNGNNYQNEYNFKNQNLNFADHLNKKLQQKKRQISQLTFGESAEANIINQSRTESIIDIRKFQKDNNNGSAFRKKFNEDNFNSVQESPSKNFQTVKTQKGFNSIKESPSKNSQIHIVHYRKVNQQNTSFQMQQELKSPKKYRESSKISEPCIIQSNYESAQLFIIGRERDELIEEQKQQDMESQNHKNQFKGQKRSFLKKGEKSRKQFDPQRSIENQKLQKQQSKEKLLAFEKQNEAHALSKNERSSSLNMKQNIRTLTPQSHKKSLNRFIQGYQSPYQQANSQISIMKQDEIVKQEPIQFKNKNLENQSLSQMKEKRIINKLNKNHRNDLESQKCDNQIEMKQNSEIISISINQQEEKRKSISFISKIPRLSSISASVCKSEIEPKNKSPVKSPVKQKREDEVKNIYANKKNSIEIKSNNFENQRLRNVGKIIRNANESKSDMNLRQSDQNQTFTSHQSSIIEKSSNRKNSIIESSKCPNTKKQEYLLEINQIIKQQNLQYIKDISAVKQNKLGTKNSFCKNQELNQELNKIRQSLVFKNIGIQKQNLASKPEQAYTDIQQNQEKSIQENLNQKQSFSQQKLSMSASQKILQMSKSKPSNRYHEKSESDSFSQFNIVDNLKKQPLDFIENKSFQHQEIASPELLQIECQQINIQSDEKVQIMKTQRSEANQYSPSINDISEARSNLASPFSKNTQRQMNNLEKLTPIKNMNFENQYVANLKKSKKDGESSPKRPTFIKQAPLVNFQFNLVGMINEQKILNTKSNEHIIDVDQFSNKQYDQNEIEKKTECEVTISIFDNKNSYLNLGLSSNFQSQNSSFQKQSIEIKPQMTKEQQNYNNKNSQQQVKKNGSHLSRFLNHNQDFNQSNTQNESSTDKDTSTFRIQPLKIGSVANTSSVMSSVCGEMIIQNNAQTNYNPIQSCNHTKYNSIYDVISTSIMNPCCSETIHKYGQSPGAKSSSPIHKMGSVTKNQDYSSQADVYSPQKKSPTKIQFKQSHFKENVRDETDDSQIQRFNQQLSDNKTKQAENQVFLYPQIIQGKQNKDASESNPKIEKHFQSIQVLQSSENQLRGTESRRRSRGERTSQQKQTAPNQKATYTRSKLNSNVANKKNEQVINEIIQEQYLHTQNSLEQPDSNVPKAFPTPQRHDQFQVRTPKKSNYDDFQSTINSNTAKQLSQYDIEASCSKTANSKRLTQQKKSAQGKYNQNSPFKTPQKSQNAQQKQISAVKQLAKTETSHKKSSKNQEPSAEIDGQKIAETIEQLKYVLSRLRNQQVQSEEHITKSRQIEQMIKNLQEQQIMFNQFIQEQNNLNIR